MNYIEALNKLKKRIQVEHINRNDNINTYYSFDFKSGLIIATQYKEEQVFKIIASTYHLKTFEMTIQEFIDSAKKNNYNFI